LDDAPVLQFYDRLANSYHLIFADWQEGVRWQGRILDQLIQAQGMMPPQSLLDCACGIGTQAIGLALQGYRVHATDLSPAAVERAGREAGAFGVSLTLGVADMRTLDRQVAGTFKVVIACDNSLPHLLELDDLRQAVRSIYAKLEPGGLFLASIRDYDRLVEEKPRATTPAMYDGDQGRRVSFQVWDWADNGRTYTVNQFLLQQVDGQWQTEHYQTGYRALLRAELSQVLTEGGFTGLHWYMPEESGYYQPIVIARSPE
jgi:SAM-dependent methyltransferase